MLVGLTTALIVTVASAGPPTTVNPSVSRLRGDAARMYVLVKRPHPDELRWQRIPWLIDLRQGIRQAKAEHRPILMFVSGDEPLEKC